MKERVSDIPLVSAPMVATEVLPKIDITDKDALRKLAINTLVSVIQANPTALAVVPALKELFDRVDGKAPQSIQLEAEIRKVVINCHIRFTDELPPMVASKTQVIDN